MPADTSIILDAGNIQGPNPNSLVSMFSLAQQVQKAKQETAKKNALLQAFSDPNSVDAATGVPTPQAIRKVMAVDPEMGLKLQDDALGAQVKRAQAAHYQTEAGKNNFDFMSSVAGVGYDAYDAAKKAGKSETDAIAAGQAARNEAAKNNGGVVGDDIVDGITGKPFDPAGARALAGTNKEWSAQRHQTETLDRQVSHDDAMEKHSQAMEDLARRGQNIRIDTGQAAKWQVLTDPKSQTQYRYNPETGQSTTLNGKEAYEPGGAAKMGSSSAAAFSPQESDLMGALAEKGISLPSGMRSKDQQKALYAGIIARNPDLSPDQIADKIKTGQIEFGAQKKETGVAATQAGKVELAQNEIKRFSPLAMQASDAVSRGSFMPITKLLQTADSSLSDPKLKTLKIYVNSIMNAYDQLAARGGTDSEKRAEARSLLTSADSPEAFKAAIEAFNKEADAAHGAAVDAMKVPELDGPSKNGGKKIDHSKTSDADLKKILGIP